MSMKEQDISRFDGYGQGLTLGEYFHSRGMRRARFGVRPGWNIQQTGISTTVTTLNLQTAFAAANPGGTTLRVFGTQISNGAIHTENDGVGTWSLEYIPGVTTGGNGLIADQKSRILYPMVRYVGKYDGTADYTTGTIAVTNGSANIVGTGTTFVAGDVDKRIVINGVWYTIATFTDATHIALSVVYAGSTNASIAYAIKRGWTDKFKDFGDNLTDTTQIIGCSTFEDWVVIPHNNVFGLYNTTDDSFTASGFTFPTGFSCVTSKPGRNGLLLAANFQGKGVLVLWNAVSTGAIAPWLWLNGTIQTVVEDGNGDWIIITSREIIRTNGYTTSYLTRRADQLPNRTGFSVNPYGAEVIASQYLAIANSDYSTNRSRAGIELLNLSTKTFEYAPPGGAQNVITMGGIFTDRNLRTHVSWLLNNTPATKSIGFISPAAPSTAFLILEAGQFGSEWKTATGIGLNLGLETELTTGGTITFNVTAKIYDFKRQLYAGLQTNAASATAITLKVDESSGIQALVGDEVTILEGANAGLIRHIASKTGEGTNACVWTLNEALTATTESGMTIVASPFQLVRKHTLTSVEEMADVYFSVKNKITAKRFLVKFLFENISENSTPLVLGASLFYEGLTGKAVK